MKTHTIHTYLFEELTLDAQKKAIHEYREMNDEIFQAEIFNSLKALLRTANIKISDYSLGLNNSYLKLNIDSPIAQLTGVRAYAWIENNLLSKLRVSRSEYLKNRKNYFTWGYRIGAIKSCPLTGCCYDETFLNSLINNVTHNLPLGECFTLLADTYQSILQLEYEDQNSDEYISEHLTVNEYEFLASGEIY